MSNHISCIDCPLYPIVSVYDYTKHRELYHQKSMVCFVNGCNSRTFIDLKQHLREAHPNVIAQLVKKRVGNQVVDSASFQVDSSTISSSNEINHDHESGREDDNDDHVIEEDYRNALDYDDSVDAILRKTMSELLVEKEENLINDKQFMNIVCLVFSHIQQIKDHDRFDFVLEQLSRTCSSTWNMRRFIENNFNYSPPIKQIISGIEVYRVSIRSIIDKALSSDMIVDQLISAQSYRPNPSGLITSFRDTQCFINESQTLFDSIKARDDVLVVFGNLYTDAFTITNPIGPFKSSSNLTGVYLTFADVKRKDKMKREDQKLVALIPNDSIEDSGFKYTYQSINEELKSLESIGFKRQIQGKEFLIIFVVAKICGDNKGMHELLGKSGSFSSGSICRTCTATYDEIQVDPFAGSMRNKFSWMEDIENLKAGIAVEGLKDEPVFNEFKYFHLSNQYPGDRLHNLLIGVYPDLMELMLEDIANAANIDLLTDTIYELKFKNGTPDIKISSGRNSRSIKGSGSQLYELFLNLPEVLMKFSSRILGTRSEDRQQLWQRMCHSAKYKLYMVLRKIDCYIRQESFTPTDLHNIHMLVGIFFEKRKECCRGQSITPKMHYLVHLTHEIRTHGPIWNYDNLPYERRHSSFIRKINTIKCRKNVSKILVDWDCRMTALKKVKNHELQILGAMRPVTSSDQKSLGIVPHAGLHQVVGIRMNNCEFKVKQIRKVRNEFAEIITIAHMENGYFSFCKMYQTICFDDDTHAYKVRVKDGPLEMIPLKDFSLTTSQIRMFSHFNIIFINKIDN